MYGTATGLLGAIGTTVAFVIRKRTRQPDPISARWASRADLRPLHVRGNEGHRLPLGRLHRRRLAAEPHQSVLVVAPTQSGKTTALAIPAILQWNGPVVATSVKTDLVRDTIEQRSTLGRTQIFDPTGSAGMQETSSWTPILACRTWQGARQTAAWLTEAASPKRGGLSDGDFWYAAAAKLLAPLLFAAATNGCTIEQVITWLDKQESSEVLAALEYAGCAEALNAMEANWSRDERQRSSIYTTAETVMEAYADPAVLAHAARPEIRAGRFLDAPADTVYLCASARNQKRLRPVFVTLLQEIIEEAYRRSASSGRPLDPSLLVVLDEAANIAPLADLDVIAATGAGHGVQLLTIFQDLGQMYDRWGRERADTILNNHRAILLGAGLSDPRSLEFAERLLGHTSVTQRSATTGSGRTSTTTSDSWRALLPPNMLRESRPGSALLIYGTIAPAQIRLVPWFADRRLRRRTIKPIVR
jgi:type IV secretion system protein VirD4